MAYRAVFVPTLTVIRRRTPSGCRPSPSFLTLDRRVGVRSPIRAEFPDARPASWGLTGCTAMAADAAVIVDVFSFSTSVYIACERGMAVYPFRWRDARATHFAEKMAAVLAVGRLESATLGAANLPSLSPSGLLGCTPVARLVLPSPNGSTIAAAAATGAIVATGCLRNASATAAWIVPRLHGGETVAVIAAGERWSADDSLRPALEDQLGAGAILSALVSRGYADAMSPEARTGADMFEVCRDAVGERLRSCVGGRELAQRGFGAE